MWADPKHCREAGLRSAERASGARTPELRIQLLQLSKSFLRLSLELERNIALRTWTDDPPSRRPCAEIHRCITVERLEEANRHVAESERIVAGWRDLIARMEAEGRNVTLARDLLTTFQDDLEAHRSNRDQIHEAMRHRGGLLPGRFVPVSGEETPVGAHSR